MSKFIVIDNNGSKTFYNIDKKIIGRIPTDSNWNRANTDNHLHFGTPGSNLIAESYLEDITGFDIDNFANKEFDMISYGIKEKVFTSISAQGHIQFLIEENGRRSGVKEIILRYMETNNLTEFKNYGIFIDFSKNKIFIAKVNYTSNDVILIDEQEQKGYKLLDDVLEKSKKYSNVNERNAYIETMLQVRNSSIQRTFRKNLLSEFNCKCAMCQINLKELLFSSHIVAYTDCLNNDERADHNNGLLLCPDHDELFDKGYISFDQKGKILISNYLPSQLYELFGIDNNFKLDNKFLTKSRLSYLARKKLK